MRRRLPLLVLLLPLATSGSATGGDVAVIVNARNPTTELSSADLEKIFKQEKQFWKDGSKVYVILQETGSAEKEIVLSKVYRMPEAELKKFWLSKMFRGEIASFPKTLASAGSVKQFVGKVPNAVGFVDVSLADAEVRVLKIDGKLPGQSGYPLAGK